MTRPVDPRDVIGCNCPRTDGKDCVRARHSRFRHDWLDSPPPEDNDDDECCCACHEPGEDNSANDEGDYDGCGDREGNR